mgnify:CR=1 FL=1
MIKFLIKFFIITFLFLSNVYSEIVKKIEISGNQRISSETILVLANISTNKKFEDKDLNKSLRELYDTNFFSDIQILLVDGILKINLVENPIIEDIEIFNKKAVYLYLRELTGLNTKQVVNNLNKLREKYRTFKTKWDR